MINFYSGYKMNKLQQYRQLEKNLRNIILYAKSNCKRQQVEWHHFHETQKQVTPNNKES